MPAQGSAGGGGMCQALPCQGDGGGEGQADDKRGSQAERKSGTEGQEEGHLSRRDNHRGALGPGQQIQALDAARAGGS